MGWPVIVSCLLYICHLYCDGPSPWLTRLYSMDCTRVTQFSFITFKVTFLALLWLYPCLCSLWFSSFFLQFKSCSLWLWPLSWLPASLGLITWQHEADPAEASQKWERVCWLSNCHHSKESDWIEGDVTKAILFVEGGQWEQLQLTAFYYFM